MQPHEQRVIVEKSELDEKIEKLESFMGKDFILTLPDDEQLRLTQQLTAMKHYSDILGDRINHFPVGE